MKKYIMVTFLALVFVPSMLLAQRTVMSQRSHVVTDVFSSSDIVGTAADTSGAVYIGDAQFFNLYYYAFCSDTNTLSNDSISLKMQYELSTDSTFWAWDTDSSGASTFETAFTDSGQWYYTSPWTVNPGAWARFIVTGTADNSKGEDDTTAVSLKLFKQP